MAAHITESSQKLPGMVTNTLRAYRAITASLSRPECSKTGIFSEYSQIYVFEFELPVEWVKVNGQNQYFFFGSSKHSTWAIPNMNKIGNPHVLTYFEKSDSRKYIGKS